jgi:hypothetical protein
MKPKLAILIPTTHDRKFFNERLKYILEWQRKQLANPEDVQILWNYNDGTIGEKRNGLVDVVESEGMSFVDSDDMVCDGYLQRGIDFVNSGMDAASLIGLYFANGVYDRPFYHSNKNTHWYTLPDRYIRTVNHLNFIKTSIAKQIPYEHKSFGEDGTMADALKASGLIKTEFEIKEVLYLYFARSKK